MEKELFHENLEAIYQYFGRDKAFTTLTQAARYCGIDARTLQADRTFPKKKCGRHYKVPLIGLARWIS